MANSSKPVNVDLGRNFVRDALCSYGFQADPITESTHKTPDLELLINGGRILIEVKSKEDDKQLRDLLNSPAGTSLQYKLSAMENILKGAWHQIKEYPERTADDLNLIWVVALLPGLTAFMRPAAMTVLYGVQNIEAWTNDDVLHDRDCFFFGNSFFFRHKELDGVVLHDNSHVILCLNPFADHRIKFRTTPLAEMFRRELLVMDPEEKERRGECFIADCTLSRKDINGVVRYLKKKYSLKSVTINQFVLMNYPVD